jgi:hypothetical protein
MFSYIVRVPLLLSAVLVVISFVLRAQTKHGFFFMSGESLWRVREFKLQPTQKKHNLAFVVATVNASTLVLYLWPFSPLLGRFLHRNVPFEHPCRKIW